VESETKERSHNVLDGTTWEFLRGGWWVLHIIAILAVFYLGRAFMR